MVLTVLDARAKSVSSRDGMRRTVDTSPYYPAWVERTPIELEEMLAAIARADFTAVDAFFAPVAFRVRTYGIDVGPQGLAWVERILAHPAMREWEDAALGETWREAGHEAELAASGSIIADFRR